MPSRKSSLNGLPNKTPTLEPSTCYRTTQGLFEIAYDHPAKSSTTSRPSRKSSSNRRHPALSMLRFLCELHGVAPKPFMSYLLCCLWMSIAPAFSLYLTNAVLDMIQTSIDLRKTASMDGRDLQFMVGLLLLSNVLSTLVESFMNENKLILGAHLKSYFLPKLAKASFYLHTDSQNDSFRDVLPTPLTFGEGAPGLNIVVELLTKARNALTVTLEVLVLARVISTKNTPDAQILQVFGGMFLGIMFFAPTNGVGGAGYTFWTTSKNYHRLSSLHSMIFDNKYRKLLAKDGASQYVCEDYRRTSNALGTVITDTLSLACYLPPPWYWLIARDMVIEYPIALYALTLPWSISQSTLVTMILIQHTTVTLRQSINTLRGGQDTAPLSVIFRQAQDLYQTLEMSMLPTSEVRDYPTNLSSQKGMKIKFRHVSLKYMSPRDEDSNVTAVKNVSFDVDPGALVVIVGGNGNGKTSLLNLLTGIALPTFGKIFIDSSPLAEYDTHQLRSSMAFLTQNEEIYPISLRDNVLIGVPDFLGSSDSENQDLVDEAALLGGSLDLIQRLGYNAILNSPVIVGQSLMGSGNGDIGPGALKELERHSRNINSVSISNGERQRLVASRTFMRVKNSDIKLLIVDEPTSALDSVAERDLFNRFLALREGKTMIFVTHRFGNIVKQADLILCMKSGQIIESGTHINLMRNNGQYAKLYKAQAEQLE